MPWPIATHTSRLCLYKSVSVWCEQKFQEREELLRNMMGLMGNVAEVDYLRSHLMDTKYVSIFRSLMLLLLLLLLMMM